MTYGTRGWATFILNYYDANGVRLIRNQRVAAVEALANHVPVISQNFTSLESNMEGLKGGFERLG